MGVRIYFDDVLGCSGTIRLYLRRSISNIMAIVKILTCHAEVRGMCAKHCKKKNPSVLLFAIVVYNLIQRSLVPRDDKLVGFL
jgi:hypothetical protein